MFHSASTDHDNELAIVIDRILGRVRQHAIPDPPPPTPEELAARRTAAWERRAARLGIPKRFRHASFGAASLTPAIRRVTQFIDDELPAGRCLLLCGPARVGKTYASIAALRQCQYPHSTFVYWPDLCARLIDSEARQDAIVTAAATGLVVFDDFGAEYLKESGLLAATIDSIVWRRHADLLPTIITTNLTPDQLRERLSDRIIERLRHDWASIHVITHGTPSCSDAPSLNTIPPQICD